jgi:amino acid permease
MRWQDWVLGTGAFLVLFSLLPTIRGPHKPALSTSMMTSVLGTIMTITLATLGLWLSAVANGAVSIAWMAIALSTVRQRREAAAAAAAASRFPSG